MDPSKDSGEHGDIPSDAGAVFDDTASSLTGLNPNALYHGIVLPPANFESVYDQRDNDDEVLSDIRQVKSELENSVLGHTGQGHGDPVVLETEAQSSSTNGFDPVAQVEVQNMLDLVDHQQTLQSTQHQHQPVQLQPAPLHQEQAGLDESREATHPMIHSIQQVGPLLERMPQHSSHQVHSQPQLATNVSATASDLQDAMPPLQMILEPTISRQRQQAQQQEALLSSPPLQGGPPSDQDLESSQGVIKSEESRCISGEVQPVIADVGSDIVGNEKEMPQNQRLGERTNEDLRELSRAILRDNASEVVTIKVEDRMPGESFMEVEVAPVTEVESESPEDAFITACINERAREEIVIQNEVAEPLKDVIVTSELDDELNDLIKLKLKTFENLAEDTATQLLAADALLGVYQGLLRKLSIPALELACLLENRKAYNPELIKKLAGSILCQLVMFNERVIRDRRAKVLTYLGKPANLADGHGMPHHSGEALFGRLFIEQHHLVEKKRSRRKITRNTTSSCGTSATKSCQQSAAAIRAKRRRKNSEASNGDDWANPIQVETVSPNCALRASKTNNEVEEDVLNEIEAPRRSGKQRRSRVSADEQIQTNQQPQKNSAARVRRDKNKKKTISTKRGIVKSDIEPEKQTQPHTQDSQPVPLTPLADVVPEFNVTESSSKVRMRGRSARPPRKTQALREEVASGVIGEDEVDEEEEDDESYDDDRDADFPQPSEVGNDEELEDDIFLDDVKTSTQPTAKSNRSDVPSLVRVERKLDNNCDHCEYVAEKRRQLVLHVKNTHPEKMIGCDACDKRFAFQISLWNHKNAMHLGAEHKCPHPHCTRSFKDEDKLRTHLFVHSAEKPFTCDICGRGCLTKVHLDSHVKVHERRDTQYCQTCNRYFGSNHTFRNHMKLHAGKKEWFCDICNAGFPIKPRLVLHKKIAHSDEQFVCDECGKGFKMKHILNDHKALIHSTRKAFVCEVCGVGFKLRSVLRRHMKTHSDERPHKCELCDKAFKVKSTLVEHRKTHTNEKPFLCEQCGVAFKRNAERRKHNCMGGSKQVVMQVPLSHDQATTAVTVAAAAAAAASGGHGHEPTAHMVASTGSTQIQLPQISTGHSGPTQLQVAVVTSGGHAATQHLVAHMPLQLTGAQMIQIMSPGTLVSGPVHGVQANAVQSGSQLMVQHVVQQLQHDVQHSEQPQIHSAGQAATVGSGPPAAAHAQFANFSVS